MMTYDPLDPQGDPFGPPGIPTEVCCLHCGQEYDSYLIEWRVETIANGSKHGFWCCPTPGCDGRGFGFDILPTDPEYRDENGGWISDDDEEFDEDADLDDDARLDALPEIDESPSDDTDSGPHRANGKEDIPW